MRRIAIFGGTFDPVHNGHLQTSKTIQAHFQFDEYYFVPCKIPTMKPSSLANSQQRIEMLQLAIKNINVFSLDLREINRNTPSYMVNTLESFRTGNEEASMTLIIGYDAFLSLHKWHEWKKIIKLANLLVINRNEYAHQQVPEEIHLLLQTQQNEHESQLLTKTKGDIVFFDAGKFDISSTEIRKQIKQNTDVSDLLPKEVYTYIKKQGLYLS